MKSCLAIRSANNSLEGWGGNHDNSLVLATEQPSNNYYLYFVWQHQKSSKDTQPIQHNNQPLLHHQPCQPRHRMYLPSHRCHLLHTSRIMTHVRRTSIDRLFAIFCNLQESDTLLESNGKLHLEWQPTNALDHTMKWRCISLAKLSPIVQSIGPDGIW